MAELFRAGAILLVSGGAIHLLYVQFIRPQAALLIEAARQAGTSAPRDLVVILKDWEQEICLILMVFCIVQIGRRMWALASEQYLFGIDLFQELDERQQTQAAAPPPPPETTPAPEENKDAAFEDSEAAGAIAESGAPQAKARAADDGDEATATPAPDAASPPPADTGARLAEALDELEELPEDMSGTHLMETLTASLRRYRITGDVQNTSDAIQASVDALSLRLEADNAMIRYIIWAIPALGFVGTVRGIGQALSQADEALAGDIAGMTASLGTAFNSTLVALVASLLLMLLLHILQRAQDRRLVDIRAYCEEFLLKRISR